MRKIFILLCIAVCLSFAAYAGVPHLINYQGRLTNNDGAPLDGIYEVTFNIYDVEAGGAPLWMEKHTGVDIEKGILSVMLGSVTDLDLAFDKPYFLEIKVNDEVMAPRQRITSVGYAMRAEKAEVANTVGFQGPGSGLDADTVDGKHAAGLLEDGSVSQLKLKTDVGEVAAYANRWTRCVLPGGEYGFYPQIKMHDHARMVQPWGARICGNGSTSFEGWTTFITAIDLHGAEEALFITARQRYITASGYDPWLFVLYDKNIEQFQAIWYAPDHPSYGQEGDENAMPHPFTDYFAKELADNLEIILVELEQTRKLENQSKGQRSMISMISEGYIIDMSREYPYIPRDISDESGRHWNVETIPDYIKVRKLKSR